MSNVSDIVRWLPKLLAVTRLAWLKLHTMVVLASSSRYISWWFSRVWHAQRSSFSRGSGVQDAVDSRGRWKTGTAQAEGPSKARLSTRVLVPNNWVQLALNGHLARKSKHTDA